MKELCHIFESLLVLFGYTMLLFILLFLSLTNMTVPAVTVLLTLLWCVGIVTDSILLHNQSERLDYGTVD
jgi:hypothetical protein